MQLSRITDPPGIIILVEFEGERGQPARDRGPVEPEQPVPCIPHVPPQSGATPPFLHPLLLWLLPPLGDSLAPMAEVLAERGATRRTNSVLLKPRPQTNPVWNSLIN